MKIFLIVILGVIIYPDIFVLRNYKLRLGDRYEIQEYNF